MSVSPMSAPCADDKALSVPQRITGFYASVLEVIDFVVSRTSDSLAEILTKALPLVAPVPNAVSIYYVSQTTLRYNEYQAAAVAASIECMFFALTEVVLKSWEAWNADKRYRLPLIVSVVAFAVYFLLVMSLVYTLEVAGGHSLAPMAFPVVSVVSAVALGVTRWHRRSASVLPDPVSPVTTPVPASPDPVAPVTTPVPASPEPVAPVTTPVPASPEPVTPVTTPVPASPEPVSPVTPVSTSERRGRLAQLMKNVEVTKDLVTVWASVLGASERTIYRDIQALTTPSAQ